MEIKLNVSIGATLQVKNAKGEWDWIKPEVGAEVSMPWGEFNRTEELQHQFSSMWNDVVGPQFESVVNELIGKQTSSVTKEEDLPEVSDGDIY
jgi:hypothetical protein